MSNSDSNRKRSPKSGWRPLLAVCCITLPVPFVVLAALIYVHNNRPVIITVPTPQMPVPNAYDDFVQAGNLARGMQHKSPFSNPRATFTFAEFEAAAKDSEPALATLRQGLQKEYLNPPYRSWKASPGFPVYSTFRELERTMSGTAMYFEMDGKPAQATEARLDGWEMAVMMPRGGPLIAGLVGVACEAIAVSQFEPQLPLLSEPELAHVALRLDRIAAKRVPFADILVEEGYVSTAGDVEMLNDPKGYGSYDAIRDLLAEDIETPAGTTEKKPLTLQQNWEAARFLIADKAAMVRDNQAYMDAIAAEARRPYAGKSSVPIPNNLLAQMRGSIFADSRARFVSMDAILSLLRTEVALLRYKKMHGRFPAALNALIPTYVTTATMTDPFGGSLLRYRPSQNGQSFLLYSVGPDLTDDSGRPSSHIGDPQGDIVAGRLWPHRTFKK